VRSVQTDARGRFRIAGLPPGERYLAVALRDMEEGEEDDPDFLRRIQNQAAPFNLGIDEKRLLDLKVLLP
jgi:hypothetical protein